MNPPIIGQNPPQNASIAVAQQVAGMARETYIRAASGLLERGIPTTSDVYQQLARDSHEVAKAFFEGLGLAQFKRGDGQ